ncbi:hypothetical protein ACE1CI_08910 [Aerosakkonemataceae cyanobacterium BLCC-F50]|uniref:Uncharacterized protein n=1 Tax=Floridaenema flaviceps BLCC-F50 TaxID=3153642 RepID=A0ABV4XMS0_9CYAN
MRNIPKSRVVKGDRTSQFKANRWEKSDRTFHPQIDWCSLEGVP